MSDPHPTLTIRAGVCHALFAYDIGFAIDLQAAARLITETTEPGTIRHDRRTPVAMEFRPAPLRVIQSRPPISIAGFASAERVECILYDFGAVSVAYAFPLGCTLEHLQGLAEALYENADLLEDSRKRVQRLLDVLHVAVDKPGIAEFVEDYAIFHLETLTDARGETADPTAVLASRRQVLAGILRAEPRPLSTQEVDDALACRIAYQTGEEALIDWNAAVLIQKEAEDVRSVLEFANVELLELRRLDDQLDGLLEQSYQTLAKRRWYHRFRLTPGRDLRRIAQYQMDSALLFEGVNNALKLVGDQYLARVYRLAAQRLHLPEWDASILRKLQTMESIYQKISDQAATRRAEVLEWIIIALIAFEIVMSFLKR